MLIKSVKAIQKFTEITGFFSKFWSSYSSFASEVVFNVQRPREET